MGAWVSSVSSATSKPVCMTLFVSYRYSCDNSIGGESLHALSNPKTQAKPSSVALQSISPAISHHSSRCLLIPARCPAVCSEKTVRNTELKTRLLSMTSENRTVRGIFEIREEKYDGSSILTPSTSFESTTSTTTFFAMVLLGITDSPSAYAVSQAR